jgi:hypothetical protein
MAAVSEKGQRANADPPQAHLFAPLSRKRDMQDNNTLSHASAQAEYTSLSEQFLAAFQPNPEISARYLATARDAERIGDQAGLELWLSIGEMYAEGGVN